MTLACRGLIVDERDGGVVARPYRKFFNHDQPDAPPLDVTAPVTVTDKLDGSLGILYREPSGAVAVATRGSFASDPGGARDRCAARPLPRLHPAGRADRAGRDRSTRRTGSCSTTAAWTTWCCSARSRSPPVARHGPEAVPELARPGRGAHRVRDAGRRRWPRRRGTTGRAWSCTSPDTDHRVKIKYAEYVRLHRLVTGSERPDGVGGAGRWARLDDDRSRAAAGRVPRLGARGGRPR